MSWARVIAGIVLVPLPLALFGLSYVTNGQTAAGITLMAVIVVFYAALASSNPLRGE